MLESEVRVAIHLPKISNRPVSIASSDNFIPVIKTRRYNLLKIKDLCQIKEK